MQHTIKWIRPQFLTISDLSLPLIVLVPYVYFISILMRSYKIKGIQSHQNRNLPLGREFKIVLF